jgi:hypothetical protein
MDRVVIEEIVAGFASTRSRIRRLAQALADRPAILADGRSPAPVAVGDLLVALRAASATAVSCGSSICSPTPGRRGSSGPSARRAPW